MQLSTTTDANFTRPLRFAPAMMLAGAILAGCSSDNNTTVTPKASAVAIVSGNSQTGVIGAGLALPLVVKVTDQNGAAMSGVLVTFTATGGAALQTASATSGANGQATDNLTVLGATVGSGSVTASVSGVAPSAVFAFTAAASTPSVVAVVSGNTQTGTVATGLTLPLVVKVTNQVGTVMSGVTVNFVGTNGATLQSASAVTDVNGLASDNLTVLGNTAGAGSVSATTSGVATPATFTFTAIAGAADKIAIVSGNNQTATVGTALAAAMVVMVTDQFDNVVTNAAVTWTTTAGAFAGTPQTVSDGSGMVQAALMVPALAGPVTVTVTLTGTAKTAVFTETAM